MQILFKRKAYAEMLDWKNRLADKYALLVEGARRVGKTFHINQALKDKFTFLHTGVSPIDQEDEKNRMMTQGL